LVIQTKGQKFIDPDAIATLDEVYEIITAIVKNNLITGIIDANTAITQEKLAMILVDTFNMTHNTPDILIQPSNNNSSPTIVQRVFNLFAKI